MNSSYKMGRQEILPFIDEKGNNGVKIIHLQTKIIGKLNSDVPSVAGRVKTWKRGSSEVKSIGSACNG